MIDGLLQITPTLIPCMTYLRHRPLTRCRLPLISSAAVVVVVVASIGEIDAAAMKEATIVTKETASAMEFAPAMDSLRRGVRRKQATAGREPSWFHRGEGFHSHHLQRDLRHQEVGCHQDVLQAHAPVCHAHQRQPQQGLSRHLHRHDVQARRPLLMKDLCADYGPTARMEGCIRVVDEAVSWARDVLPVLGRLSTVTNDRLYATNLDLVLGWTSNNFFKCSSDTMDRVCSSFTVWQSNPNVPPLPFSIG